MTGIRKTQVEEWNLENNEFSRNLHSGFTQQQIDTWFLTKSTLTWQDVGRLSISSEAKTWLLLHADFLTDRELRLAACTFAERVLPIANDSRSANCIRLTKAWIEQRISWDMLKEAGKEATCAAEDAAKKNRILPNDAEELARNVAYEVAKPPLFISTVGKLACNVASTCLRSIFAYNKQAGLSFHAQRKIIIQESQWQLEQVIQAIADKERRG